MLRSPWARVAALAVLAGVVWLPFAGRLAEPRRGRPADAGRPVVARVVAVRRLLRRPSAGADRAVRRRRRRRRRVGAARARHPGGRRHRAARRRSVGSPRPAGRRRRCSPAPTAAVLAATPLFGGTVVNGELLGPAVPARRDARPRSAPSGPTRAARPAVGACSPARSAPRGALVKQSLLDVFVLAVVLLPGATPARPRWPRRRRRRGGDRRRSRSGPPRLRGTDPGELWDAVVVFRQQAAVGDRRLRDRSDHARGSAAMLLALLATGAPLLAVVLARRLPRAAPAARPALAGARRARLGDLRGARRRQLLAALPDGPGARPGAARPRPPPAAAARTGSCARRTR